MSATVSATKVCTKCKSEKPLDCFFNRAKSLDGKGSSCKTCEYQRIQKYQKSENGRLSIKKYRSKESYKMRDCIHARRFGKKIVSELRDSYILKLLKRSPNISKEAMEAKKIQLLTHRTKDFFGLFKTINQLQNITMENIDKDIAQFISLIAQGAECLQKAGKLLIEMEKKNPNALNLIVKKCPSMNLSRLETIKRVGLGELNPYLLLDGSPGAVRLLQLPPVAQNKYMTEPIPVAVVSGGSVKVEYKRLGELSSRESEIVFNAKRARTPEEQVEMIRNKLATRHALQNLRYEIDGEKVTFYAHSTFTREQLEEILGKIPKTDPAQLESTIKKNQISK